MEILEAFLLLETKEEERRELRLRKKEKEEKGLNGSYVYFLFKTLAHLWDEDIDLLLFLVEEKNSCLRGVPEPHAVVTHGDMANISIYSDSTEIMRHLDLGSALVAIIALHFLTFVKYSGKEKYLVIIPSILF